MEANLMKSKKVVSLLVLLTLMITLLTGCNSAEFNYWEESYKQYETAMNTNAFATAEIKISSPSIDQITNSMSAEDKESAEPFLNYIRDGKFKMEVAQNVKADQQMVRIYGMSSTDSDYKMIYEMVRIDQKNYLKIEPLRDFITKLLPNEEFTNEEVMKIVGNSKYLVISDDELYASFNGSQSSANPMGLNFTGSNMGMSSSEQLKRTSVIMQIANDVVRKGFEGYSPGLIKQEGNKFIYTLEIKNIGHIASEFISYSIDHNEKLQEVMFNSAKSIPATAFATLLGVQTLTENDKLAKLEEMQATVKESLKDIKSQKEMILTSINEAQPEIAEMFGDSKMVSSVQFKDENHNVQDFTMNLNLKMPTDQSNFILNMSGTSSAEYNSPYVVTAPTGKMISLTALMSELPKVYRISPSEKMVYYSEGMTPKEADLDMVQIKGHNYIALEDAKIFTDGASNVDLKKKTAVLTKGDKKAIVAISIINKKPYMRIRELEKLGFEVTWDDLYELIIVKEGMK